MLTCFLSKQTCADLGAISKGLASIGSSNSISDVDADARGVTRIFTS